MADDRDITIERIVTGVPSSDGIVTRNVGFRRVPVTKSCEDRLADIQLGLARVDPMQRSSPETISCIFCGADKTHSYVTGDRTPHTDDCEWRLACEARGLPWNHVL